ncbi:MAG: hypothetical protein JWO85_1002 [Candidatus Eremiobacteraeota bacterium]|jgi:hypothetical protein|nr:hypothetical protein [Candidatus Eremiobacteraeota bacterium]
MPSSAETAREAVIRILLALERSCLDAEAALGEQRWPDVEAALGAQAGLTGDLAAVFEAAPEFAPERDQKVAERVRGILSYREDQLHRLQAYNAEIGARLQSIGRMNNMSRSIGRRNPAGRVFDGQY